MSCTYTNLHSSSQCNSTYHAQTCPTTTHSCEQAMYCTHVSVWSVELQESAAAMCCAPSAPMEFSQRLCAHVCVRRAIHRTCVARSHIYNRERDHIHYAYVHADIPNTNTHACLACILSIIPVQNAIVHTMHKRAPPTTHSCEQTLTRVFGVRSCGQVLQQCAALPPRLWSLPEGCTHMCV
jgi:hypothetical protein